LAAGKYTYFANGLDKIVDISEAPYYRVGHWHFRATNTILSVQMLNSAKTLYRGLFSIFAQKRFFAQRFCTKMLNSPLQSVFVLLGILFSFFLKFLICRLPKALGPSTTLLGQPE
jgi:hypothetical protein